MTPSLVIFDCDGVLVDSERLAAGIFAEAITQIGLPTTPAQAMKRYKGRTMAACVRMIEESLGRPLPDGWLDAVQARTFAAFEKDLKAVAGVETVICQLREAGIAFCVASSGAPEKMAVTLGLTGLKGYFEGRIFSAVEVKRGKPHPDLFLRAAARMGHAPEHCAVIEDSVPGAVAGVAAGMTVYGYAGDPSTDKEGLARAGATVFGNMADLPGLLGL